MASSSISRSVLAFALLIIPVAAILSEQYQQASPRLPYDGPVISNTTIPGSSPFDYCEQSSIGNDLFQIEWIALTPTPPNIGDAFTFQAHGYFTENLTANATVNVTGWYETNPLAPFSSTKDFCKMADQVDMDDYGLRCPPPQGNGTITAVEVVPWGLPGGNYSARIDALTEDGRRIFCVEGWAWMKDEGGGWRGDL